MQRYKQRIKRDASPQTFFGVHVSPGKLPRKTRLLALRHCLERERAYSKQNPAERAYSEQNSTGPSDQNSSVYILRAKEGSPKVFR